MVWQLSFRLFRCCSVLLTLLLSAPSAQATESLLQTEKQYRLAAWYFYRDDEYQALLHLSLAPEPAAKARLLQAGLFLQLDMPAATAALLEQLLAEQTLSGALPQELRNVALLQFSQYQFEQQQPEQARFYFAKLTAPLLQLTGQATLLQQMLTWPNITPFDDKVFQQLAGQAELPYVVINHILALRQQQKSAQALPLLARLNTALSKPATLSFWQQLFREPSTAMGSDDRVERDALADYLLLLKAGLLVDEKRWAEAQQVLRGFASNSVLTLPAMTLYRDVLIENRQIPVLLAVLQQLITRYPLAPASWLAAHQIGMQLELTFEQQQALAAYRWAEQYYQRQLTANAGYLVPVTAEQLANPDTLTPWQFYQLRQQAALYQLNRQLDAVAQLQQQQQQRLARLTHLTEVVQSKLLQQQQLLTQALPRLTAKQQGLQAQNAALAETIRQAQTEPMAQLLWLNDGEQAFSQQQQMLTRASRRLQQLAADGRDMTAENARLQRLKGLLTWHYQQNSAERRYQLAQLQQQLAAELQQIDSGIQRLTALEGKTTRLLAQQQQLTQSMANEQGFSVLLAEQQQQLLRSLNQALQQQRLAEREQLMALQRLNTQAIARLMEQVLLSTEEAN
ncbi:hypothetical protein L1N97_02140 [Rheinheimera sp. UJ63]|nr:hypothetical protein [Rheinheimera sp. UJ63]